MSVRADQMQAQRMDERALPCSGYTSDADSACFARVRQDGVEHAGGECRVGSKFAVNQRDGTRENHAVALEDAIDVLFLCQAAAARLNRRLRHSADP